MSCARPAVSAIAALAVIIALGAIAATAAPARAAPGGAPPARAAPAQLMRKTLAVNGAVIELSVEQVRGAPSSPADIERWVRRAAVAVAAVYGGFPMRRVRVMVWRIPGRGIHGTAFGSGLVRVRLGVETPPERLESDWVMTHELIHLGFPDLDDRHIWMEEGLSTYFEPIARARVGQVPVEQVWRELFRDLPQGLQRGGDAGLDRTPSWGATYWGGALFWLLADVQIRERTGNRRSADDALRAILAAGGDQSHHWPIEQVLAVGDGATGTHVLAGLYRRLALRRFEVDLRGLAARLGVTGSRLDDRAPLAAIRRSITAPEPRRAR